MSEYLTTWNPKGTPPECLDKVQVNGPNAFFLLSHTDGCTTIVSPSGYRLRVNESVEIVREHFLVMDGNYVFRNV